MPSVLQHATWQNLHPRGRATGPEAWITWREQADVTEPTAGPRPSSSPRGESLAARLAALTGSTPRITHNGLCARIEADLPAKLSEARRHLLLQALVDADRCGHDAADGYVWAEIRELPDPARLTTEQRAGYECALCGMRLYTSRCLGTVNGVQLWGCSPAC